jgi:exodeoxyribonuclease-1
MAIILPLCLHPSKSNEVVVYDLSISPLPLLELSAEEIRQRLFIASADLPEGVDRIPLKTIHINKCPVLTPVSAITAADAERLHIDKAVCAAHLQLLKAASGLNAKLADVYNREYTTDITDPDLMIYSGGFFSNRDKALMTKIRSASPKQLASFTTDFDDKRLPEMLFRYRARNFPDSLSTEETALWREFCHARLHEPAAGGGLSLDSYLQKIRLLRADAGDKQRILDELEDWAEALRNGYSVQA